MQKSVLVIGGDGMLGHMLVYVLLRRRHRVVWTTIPSRAFGEAVPYDALVNEPEKLLNRYGPFEAIINAAAILKNAINEKDPESVNKAMQLNGEFPHILAQAAGRHGSRMVQISTDAVFSSQSENCGEDTPTCPDDVYGTTKLYGEPDADNVITLRLSIVGPDPIGNGGILEWVRSLSEGTVLKGFVNHNWTGCTTLQAANICEILICKMFDIVRIEGGVHHFCPCETITKYELVKSIVRRLGKNISVKPVQAPSSITRRMCTIKRNIAYASRPVTNIGTALKQIPEKLLMGYVNQ